MRPVTALRKGNGSVLAARCFYGQSASGAVNNTQFTIVAGSADELRVVWNQIFRGAVELQESGIQSVAMFQESDVIDAEKINADGRNSVAFVDTSDARDFLRAAIEAYEAAQK